MNIAVTTEYIKLESLLKLAGAVSTGGQAKEVIQTGKVKVNGETCTMRGKKLRNDDKVEFENEVYVVTQPAQANASVGSTPPSVPFGDSSP